MPMPRPRAARLDIAASTSLPTCGLKLGAETPSQQGRIVRGAEHYGFPVWKHDCDFAFGVGRLQFREGCRRMATPLFPASLNTEIKPGARISSARDLVLHGSARCGESNSVH